MSFAERSQLGVVAPILVYSGLLVVLAGLCWDNWQAGREKRLPSRRVKLRRWPTSRAAS